MSRVSTAAGKVSSGIPAARRAVALPTRFKKFREKAGEKKEEMLKPFTPERNLFRKMTGRRSVAEQGQWNELEKQRAAKKEEYKKLKASQAIKADYKTKRPEERWEKERNELKKAEAEREREKARDEKVAEGLEKERIREEIKRKMEAEKTLLGPDGKPASGDGNTEKKTIFGPDGKPASGGKG